MYAKIFRQIFESSISEKPEVRFTFMDLLILANRDGVVDMTPESIARITNRPLTVINQTLRQLECPDPRSRTKEAEGARIKRLDDHRDWGWVIINFDKFRAIATDDQYREKNKERVRRYRQNIRKTTDVTLRNVTVTPSNGSVMPPSAYANASVPDQGGTGGKGKDSAKHRFVVPTLEEVKLFCAKSGIPENDALWFFEHEEGNGWTNGGKPIRSWPMTLMAWKRMAYLPSQRAAASSGKFQRNYHTAVDSAQLMIENFKPDA